MEKIFLKWSRILFVLSLAGLTLNGFSQSKKEAVDAYNQGISLVKTNPSGAVDALNKCIQISEQLGEEGADTKTNAEQKLPLAYYEIALSRYKQKQIDDAIKGFEKAKKVALQCKNEEIAKKSEKIIPQLYYIKGNMELKKKDYDAALASYDKSLELMPNLSKSFLRKAQVYKIRGDMDKMLASLDKAIEYGMTTHDRKTVSVAEKLARNTMFNNAVSSIEKKDWEKAETYLKKSIEYGNKSSEVFYQLGKVYNDLEKWDIAIKNINRAVELDKGEPPAKAKYFFELGNAYKGLGNNAQACDAYKKALYGAYEANAKYQIETVLKCK